MYDNGASALCLVPYWNTNGKEGYRGDIHMGYSPLMQCTTTSVSNVYFSAFLICCRDVGERLRWILGLYVGTVVMLLCNVGMN